jgi:protein-disulfide isomerase
MYRVLPALCALSLLASGAEPKSAKKKAPAKAAVTASPSSPVQNAFSKPTLESYIRHLFVWGPQIKITISDPQPAPMPGFKQVKIHASAGNASQVETFYISDDGRNILRGQVFDLKDNPFREELKKLKTEFEPSFGTPGAPVVLVIFSDFQCTFCREEAKMLRDNLLSAYPKQVRVYFKDFPLEQIHPWAKAAAVAGQCVFRQNAAAFWEYHDWIFEKQTEVTPENLKDKVLAFAKGKEIDPLQLGRCLDAKSTEADVDKDIAQARELAVQSTPTVFINGRRVTGRSDWNTLRSIIDYEIEYQKTAKNAGEDCACDVTLPNAFPK